MIQRGQIYKHYKGNLYLVLELATHIETEEKLVVYRNIKDETKIWTRPLSMFEDILSDGKPRFKLEEGK